MTVTRRSALAALGAGLSVGGVGTAVYGDGGPGSRSPKALVAGSLLWVADGLGDATVEAHGSAAVRRLVVEGARDPDAVALADPRLFDGVADRAALFATNALVVAYDSESPHAAAIRRDWRAALRREDCVLGRTDPDVDPLGYRTVMALRLAGREAGFDASAVLDRSRVVRETDLPNVLEAGGVDAAVVYRNMAVQRGLPYVGLPDRVDFSTPARAETYATASYELPEGTVRGAPIRYAATALTDRGEPWVDRLVTAGGALRDAGFVVPEGYPRRDVPVGRE
ncbi:MAG: extracellular solute-binding protein [Haloferacaceae archaeon]